MSIGAAFEETLNDLDPALAASQGQCRTVIGRRCAIDGRSAVQEVLHNLQWAFLGRLHQRGLPFITDTVLRRQKIPHFTFFPWHSLQIFYSYFAQDDISRKSIQYTRHTILIIRRFFILFYIFTFFSFFLILIFFLFFKFLWFKFFLFFLIIFRVWIDWM